jgi:hypothetical protein
MVFCEYPILDDEGQFAPDGSGTIELCLGGAPELFCKVRILPKRLDGIFSTIFGANGSEWSVHPANHAAKPVVH